MPLPDYPNALTPTENEAKLLEAEALLRRARELAKEAGAAKFVDKIRRALKSGGGAIRHAHLAPFREERHERDGARARLLALGVDEGLAFELLRDPARTVEVCRALASGTAVSR